MAHFARIDENNVVLEVMIVNNEEILDENGNESEEIGRTKLNEKYGGRWIQTSYNNNIRYQYAGIGKVYDEELDIFRPAQPFPSWTFNRETYEWEAPVQFPSDGDGPYIWSEVEQNWKLRFPKPESE